MMKVFLWRALVLISLALHVNAESSPHDSKHPDDYYKKFNEDGKTHTMVKYKGIGDACRLSDNKIVVRKGAVNNDEKQRFLKVHNDYRRKVAKGLENRGAPGPQPQAANMRELVWDDELAKTAQLWVKQCPGKHGTPEHDANRRTDRYKKVGQNVFLDSKTAVPRYGSVGPPLTATPEKAGAAFYNEVGIPGFDKSNVDPFVYNKKTTHYTQMIWANTESIGCGFIMLRTTEHRIWYKAYTWQMFTVCNYGPAGNSGERLYKIGSPGSDCPQGTGNNDGLCSPSSAPPSTAETVFTPATAETITTSPAETVATPAPAQQQEVHTTTIATTTTTTTTVATTTAGPSCPKPDSQYLCKSGKCIDADWKCDGFEDCDDGDDEAECEK